MASPSDLSTPDPEWVEFVKAFPIPALVGSPAELRQMSEGFKALRSYTEPIGLTIQAQTIPAYNGASGKVRIYKPDNLSKPAKTIA